MVWWKTGGASRKPVGLSTRFLVVCLGLYLLIASGAAWWEIAQVSQQARHTAQDEIASLSRTFGPPLEAALWAFDDGQLSILLDVLAEIPAVGRVKLTSLEGKVYERSPGSIPPGSFGEPHVVVLAHKKDNRFVFVGNLTIESSLTAVEAQVNATIARAVSRTALVVILLSAVLVFTVARVVARPLRALASRISQIDPHSPSLETLASDPEAGAELGLVSGAFNRLLAELMEVNASLESKVASRTLHLEQTIEELSSTRDRLVASAKMAVLGQLVAGVAHDLNTPLGAAVSAANSALHLLNEGRADWVSDPVTAAVLARAADPADSMAGHRDPQVRRQLVREVDAAGISSGQETVDALEDLGILPPLGDLGPLLATPQGQLALGRAHRYFLLSRSCHIMGVASEKMAAVVDNLLGYSRKEDSSTYQPTDLAAQLHTVLLLFASSFKGGVQVVRRFEPVPPVLCRADRLQQVWINLVTNALQAMGGRGTLELQIHQVDTGVEVTVANDGPPIPADVADKLFTPFFTTKPQGAGTGLGLSICQRIIEEHSGHIGFTSVPGRTAFTVTFASSATSSRSAS